MYPVYLRYSTWRNSHKRDTGILRDKSKKRFLGCGRERRQYDSWSILWAYHAHFMGLSTNATYVLQNWCCDVAFVLNQYGCTEKKEKNWTNNYNKNVIKFCLEVTCLKAIVPGASMNWSCWLWLTADFGDYDVWPNVPKVSYSWWLDPG
jgi:hypothetical protein